MNKTFEKGLAVAGLVLVMTCIFGLQFGAWRSLDILRVAYEHGDFAVQTLLTVGLGMVIWLIGSLPMVLLFNMACKKQDVINWDHLFFPLSLGAVTGCGAACVSGANGLVGVIGAMSYGWAFFAGGAVVMAIGMFLIDVIVGVIWAIKAHRETK